MFFRKPGFKNLTAVIIIIAIFLFSSVENSIAQSISIKGIMKIDRMDGYIILINYETRDQWTDNILFKVHCKFREKELTFTSSLFNNVKRGWHKTQVAISDAVKKRHGFLREYKVELYKNGILIDTKTPY